MKIVRFLMAMFVCFFTGVLEVMAADASAPEKERLPLPRPIAIRNLPTPQIGTRPNGITVLNIWQNENLKREFISAEPVIENDMLIAWDVISIPTKKFKPKFFSYLPAEDPFLLPKDMSSQDMLNEVWNAATKVLLSENPRPVAVSHFLTKDGHMAISGVWYSVENSDAKVDAQGKLHYREIGVTPERFFAKGAARAVSALPLPAEVAKNPERYILPRDRTPDVQIGEAKVVAGTVMGNWQFRYNRGTPRKTEHMRIVDLSLESPITQMGIKPSMFIWSVNGVTTVGLLSSDGFKQRVLAALTAEGIRFEVSDTEDGPRRFIVVPLDGLIRTGPAVAATYP